MTGFRATATIATLIVAGAWGAVPAAAAGGPLLSGYGGPGEGNQAILGSTLLGGAGSGEGGSGGPGGPSDGAEGIAATRASGSSAAGNGSRNAAGAGGRHGRGARSGGRPAHNGSGAAGVGARSGPAHPALSLTDAGDSQTLGLSSGDVLYILVALGALSATGALTSRLARYSR
jgi:hypothetical protein